MSVTKGEFHLLAPAVLCEMPGAAQLTCASSWGAQQLSLVTPPSCLIAIFVSDLEQQVSVHKVTVSQGPAGSQTLGVWGDSCGSADSTG